MQGDYTGAIGDLCLYTAEVYTGNLGFFVEIWVLERVPSRH
jgi:hypothetical protein